MSLDYPRGASIPDADGVIIADRHLYLDASESRVVEEGDAASAFQFVAKGHPISKADVERLGLSVGPDGTVVLPGAAPSVAPESQTAPNEEQAPAPKVTAKKARAKRKQG